MSSSLTVTNDWHSYKLPEQLNTGCEKGYTATQNNHENILNFVLQDNKLLNIAAFTSEQPNITK